MQSKSITCKDISSYSEALTKGRKYEIIDEGEENVRIIGNTGNTRWYPKYCFDLEGKDVAVLVEWKFDDYVEEDDSGEDYNWVEINFKLSDGTERWSILYTPERLLTNLKRPDIDPPGLNIPHLIIVRSYRKDDVDRILKYLDDNGELISASLPLNRVDE